MSLERSGDLAFEQHPFVPDETSFVRTGPIGGYVRDVMDRLSMVRDMDVATLQRVIDLPDGDVQQRVRTLARVCLRKLTKAGMAERSSATGAAPARVTTSRRIQLNDVQRDHLLRYGAGHEQAMVQMGRSKRTSAALYGRGLLYIIEENEQTKCRRYDLTEKGRALCGELTEKGDTHGGK